MNLINRNNQKIDSIFDNVIRDCRNESFHTFEYKCIYDKKIPSNTNDEKIDVTVSDSEMNIYGLNIYLKNAGEYGSTFNQIMKLKKIDSSLSNINIC